MNQLENAMQGLLAPSIEITIESETPELDEKEALKNREFVKKHWMLGPENPDQPSTDYWRKIATVWRTSPEQAKRKLCANCEYFNDSPEMLEQMESIPVDEYDKNGGGRGWCTKFDFVCHSLRTCQAWEKAEQPEDKED